MQSDVPIDGSTPVNAMPAGRELGWVRGEFTVPDNFDASLPAEVEDSFYK